MNQSAESTSKPIHTIVLSDIHLTDAEPNHPGYPLWKRYKRRKLFIDRKFQKFLDYIHDKIHEHGSIELILNGDIFDFDSVMAVPEDPAFPVSWLEKSRGLAAEEPKSRFKIKTILNDHPIWLNALRDFVLRGHNVVFVIGNHDIELHWPSVQKDIIDALNLPDEAKQNIRFCEWFYISNADTLVEHGNQYDDYCVCPNPINPLIRIGKDVSVRIPFGNISSRFISNGMGLLNPHVEESFIRTFNEHVVFFLRYQITTQPLVIWSWLWGAFMTWLYSIIEGFLPALRDPLTFNDRVKSVATRSNSTEGLVIALRELRVHPAIFNPFRIMKELWLDRALFFLLLVFGSFQFFSFINLFYSFSIWFFILPFLLLMPVFIFYANNVTSDMKFLEKVLFKNIPVAARIIGVKRVVHGHTHSQKHLWLGDVEYLNCGTWSPAYRDIECTKPYGRKCFAWIKPSSNTEGAVRIAELYEWTDKGPVLIEADQKSRESNESKGAETV